MPKKPKQYGRVLSLALEHPWAITPPMLTTIATVLARHLSGGALEAGDTSFVTRDPAMSTASGGVLVIPMHGVITPRMNLFSDISGGATFEEATQQLREAVAAPGVSTILFDWDSPGGSAAGATEFAREMLKARAVKPVISHANFQMCSGAYWTGACATEVIASPSAVLGSIGVYTLHEDLSKALEDLGVKLTFVSAGKYKVDGNPAEPLSETARARLTALVTATYDHFVADVAEGRHASAAAVRSGYGEGSVLNADEALAAGLIDRIEPFDDTLARLLSEPTPNTRRIAAQNELETAMHALTM